MSVVCARFAPHKSSSSNVGSTPTERTLAAHRAVKAHTFFGGGEQAKNAVSTTTRREADGFKGKHLMEVRRAESTKILTKFPYRVPVIVERVAAGSWCGAKPTINQINKTKFLIPSNLTVGQLLMVVRNRIDMPPTDSLFLFVDTGTGHHRSLTLPPASVTLAEVYEQSKDADGFLYIKYSGENVFGADASSSYQTRRIECCVSPTTTHTETTFNAASSSSQVEFVSSKQGVARRLRTALSNHTIKRKAQKQAKLNATAVKEHRGSNEATVRSPTQSPTPRRRRLLVEEDATTTTTYTTTYKEGGGVELFRAETLLTASEKKKLKQPMLEHTASSGWGRGKYRNYGTIETPVSCCFTSK